MTKRKHLVYFVEEIETSFVINDLIKLSECFEQIYLFCANKIPDKSKVPANVRIIEEYIDWNSFRFVRLLGTHLFFVARVYLLEIWKSKRLIPLKKNLASLVMNIFKADAVFQRLRKEGLDGSDIVRMPFYAFWFYDTSYLGVLKCKYHVRTTVARAHSGDLYENHTSRAKRSDLRHFQLGALSALLPVSAQGTAYMVRTYPDYKEKIHTVYLGTKDGGLNEYVPDSFNLVSCARFNHHKRLDKIAESLLGIKTRINWIHIGDERLGEDIPRMKEYLEHRENLSAKPNVHMNPTGAVDNDEIFRFYKKQPVSLFISLSENEGIPVSIMEAISFGIPVLATNAGGCSEIVNENTGMLVPVDIKPEKVAAILDEFPSSPMNTPEFRQRVRHFWQEHFSEEKNYRVLLNYIS